MLLDGVGSIVNVEIIGLRRKGLNQSVIVPKTQKIAEMYAQNEKRRIT